MEIDKLFLLTAPSSIFTAAILYFSFRRRVERSWTWRIAISVVLALGTAPIIFPDMRGGYGHPHIFVLLRWFPSRLFEREFYSSPAFSDPKEFLAFLWLEVLPFVLTMAGWLFLMSVLRRFKNRHEKQTT